jgi:hypothetical protein
MWRVVLYPEETRRTLDYIREICRRGIVVCFRSTDKCKPIMCHGLVSDVVSDSISDVVSDSTVITHNGWDEVIGVATRFMTRTVGSRIRTLLLTCIVLPWADLPHKQFWHMFKRFDVWGGTNQCQVGEIRKTKQLTGKKRWTRVNQSLKLDCCLFILRL